MGYIVGVILAGKCLSRGPLQSDIATSSEARDLTARLGTPSAAQFCELETSQETYW